MDLAVLPPRLQPPAARLHRSRAVHVRIIAAMSRRSIVLWAAAAGLSCCASDAVTGPQPPAPVPLQQTRVQKQLLDETIPIAATASREAEASLLKLFDEPLTRQYLKELDSRASLHSLSATVLTARFWDALSAAELVHSFGDGDAKLANCGFDLSVSMGEHSKVFYNQWQLQALGLVPVDAAGNVFTEWSEVNLFHFPEFRNDSSPDLSTASDRPFYAALNMYRGSGGNPQCGPVAAVLSRTFVANRILAAPFDTGFFQGSCGDGQTTGQFGNVQMPVCLSWPNGSRVLGVPPHLSHLVEPYLLHILYIRYIHGSMFTYKFYIKMSHIYYTEQIPGLLQRVAGRAW